MTTMFVYCRMAFSFAPGRTFGHCGSPIFIKHLMGASAKRLLALAGLALLANFVPWATHAQFSSPPRAFGYGSIESIRHSPDESILAALGGDGIHLFDSTTLRDLAHLKRARTPSLSFRDADQTFSPDGRFLAAPYEDTTVVVWDLRTLAEAAVLPGHTWSITALGFSADGSLLGTGDSQGGMKVWSTDTWELVAEHTSEWVRALTFQGGDRLITSNGYRAIRVWRLPGFEEELLLVHGDNVRHLIMLPDGRRLLSAADDGTARLWDLQSGGELAVMPHAGYASELLLAPDGRHAVIRGSSSTHQGIHVWRLDPLEKIGALNGGPIGFSGDPPQLWVWNPDEEGARSVRSWDLETRQYVDSVPLEHGGGYPALGEYSMQLTIVNTDAGSIERYDLSTGSLRMRRRVVFVPWVEDLAFSPGGEWLATPYSRSIHFWDTTSGEPLLTLENESIITSLAFGSDCRDLFVADRNGLWRRPLRDLTTPIPVREGFINEVAFVPRVGRAALGWQDGKASVFDLATGAEIEFEGPRGTLSTVGLSPDGSLLVGSGYWENSPSTWLWRVTDLKLLGKLSTSLSFGPHSFGFNPEGHLLGIARFFDGVQLWSTNPIALVDSFATTPNYVLTVDFSPDGRWMAWAEPGPQPLRLFDLESGARIEGRGVSTDLNPWYMEFSPDGSMIAISGQNSGRLLVWDADESKGESQASPCSGIDLARNGPSYTAVRETVDAAASLDIALEPGRPNPFNASTVIPFRLPRTAPLRLEIVNLAGQNIRVLTQRVYEAGTHEVVWDGRDRAGRDVGSGVYLIRLRAAGVERHGKLLVLR